MARMPQIPGVDYGQRPDSGVPRTVLPADGSAGIERGANGIENLGDMAYKDEAAHAKALADALEAKQKIVDTVTSTRMTGDFEEKLRNQMDAIKRDLVDTPEKAPDEFTTRARQLADDMLKAAPNSEVGLALAQKTGSVINQGTGEVHSWAQLRMTQKAKSDLSVMVNQATRGAEDQGSVAGLEAYARVKHASLDPLFESLTADHKDAKLKLDNELAKSWVTAAGARDPVGTMKALDSKDGFLVKNLSAEDRDHLRRQTESSFTGMGKFKTMQGLKEGVDLTGNAYELFRKGELTSGTVFSMAKSLEQKKQAVSLDPNMDKAARDAQLKNIDVQMKTLQSLDDANRKQTGFDATDDERTRATLIENADKLFGKDAGTNAKDMGEILKFRHDLAVAYAGNQITRSTFGTYDKHLSLILPKSMSKEQSNTGTFFGFALPWQSARQAGNVALNDYLDAKNGMLGNLTPKQQADARVLYVEHLNLAMEQGQNIDEAATQSMARKAAYYVAGKTLPGGK